MKKLLVLVTVSLAAFMSQAAQQRLNISGYRIGDSGLLGNDGRIVATNLLGISTTDSIVIDSDPRISSAFFSASVPAGQEVLKWLYCNKSPVSERPSQTNVFAGAVTEYVWNYNNDTANKYIIVDYDYITYTLNYNANGGDGSMPSESRFYTNSFSLAGNEFSRTGYAYDGWTNAAGRAFADRSQVSGASFGVTYTNATTRTANLFAKWVPHTYTVSFSKNTDDVVSGEMAAMPMTYDVPANLTQNAFVRSGYRFGGWATAPDGATAYADGASVVNLTDVDGGAVTLYAKWSEKAFTLRYYLNDGTGVSYVQNCSSASPIQMYTPPARPGYAFLGWAKTSDGNAEYFTGNEYSIDPGDSDVFLLYAAWAPIGYSIAFDSNGGEGQMQGRAVEYGEVYVLPECGFTKAGVSFTGWTTNVADGVEFNVGDSVSNLTATASSVVTFYAVWSEPRFVAFDGNGADNPAAMEADVMTFEGVETKALVAGKFAKTGYTFGGWATNEATAAALAVVYTNCEEVVSTSLWMPVGETNVLYAVWQTNAYTVVFNPNGGTGEMEGQHFVYDQSQPLAKCGFFANLRFDGWATSPSGPVVFGDEEVVSNLTAEADGSVALYAHWSRGDLSPAMHCEDLVWAQNGEGTPWEVAQGDGEGYNPSGSSVSNSVYWSNDHRTGYSRDLVIDPNSVSYILVKSGKLSFWYKICNNGPCWLEFQNGTTENLYGTGEWTQYGPIDVDDISEVVMRFVMDWETADDGTVWIDQMTWVPAGSGPTEDDKPVISGFAATAGGFALSVDGGSISDSFGYQVLATNELVNGDWPVKTNLTAEALRAGYEIVPESGEPRMFYKVRVVPK